MEEFKNFITADGRLSTSEMIFIAVLMVIVLGVLGYAAWDDIQYKKGRRRSGN